jgi:ADP-ribosylglycohydrolase
MSTVGRRPAGSASDSSVREASGCGIPSLEGAMLGAIAGDIIGSPYEFDFNNIKTTDFPLFGDRSVFTDDTILTVATAEVLLTHGDYAEVYKKYHDLYPDAGWGSMFSQMARAGELRPYNSFGNGSAMRVSPIGFAFDTFEETLAEAERSAAVTHDHLEGIKGARATAAAVFLARIGESKDAIRGYITGTFAYDLSRTLDEIRPVYCHVESCQETVPEAITAFLESDSFEDAIRKAVSLGGDSDTLACITGGIAEAFYGGVPPAIRAEVERRLDPRLLTVVEEFYNRPARARPRPPSEPSLGTPDDAAGRIVSAVRALGIGPTAGGPGQVVWQSGVYVVADCIFSAQTRYHSVVKPMLDRWATLRPAMSDRADLTFSEFLADVETYGEGKFEAYGSQVMTRQVLAGRRKVEVCCEAARFFVERGIETAADLRVREDLRALILEDFQRAVRGVGPALARYLLMLLGDEDEVKPDVHILRFWADIGLPPAAPGEMVAAFRDAARTLGATAARLDAAIWVFSSNGGRANASL